jgi:hypothetical protein
MERRYYASKWPAGCQTAAMHNARPVRRLYWLRGDVFFVRPVPVPAPSDRLNQMCVRFLVLHRDR